MAMISFPERKMSSPRGHEVRASLAVYELAREFPILNLWPQASALAMAVERAAGQTYPECLVTLNISNS